MAVLALIGACADPTGPRAAPMSRPLASAAGGSGSAGAGGADTLPDLTSVQRFTIELAATGALVPRAPVRVTATIRANLATEAARVRIVAPDLAASKDAAWRPGHVPVNVRLRPQTERTTALRAGQETVERATLVFPEPGYYRIIASASGDSAVVGLADGRWIQNTAAEELWVLIDQRGGVQTRRFDRARLDDSVLALPGPRVLKSRFFRTAGGGLRARRTPDRGRTGEVRPLDVTDPNTTGMWGGPVVYYDVDAGAYVPVSGYGNVRFNVYDSYAQDRPLVANANGGISGGYFSASCPSWAGEQWEGQLDNLRTADASVFSTAGPLAYPGISYPMCDFEITMDIDAGVGETLKNLQPAITASRSVLGRSRGLVTAYVNSYQDGGANYRSSDDRIRIFKDALWGGYGAFTAAHEYGHAAHEKALGGNAASGQCPSIHYIYGYYSLSCAFSEGFANFHGAMTTNDPSYVQFLRTYTYTSYWDASKDGAIQEGAVAAFMLDAVDAANAEGPYYPESWDAVSQPSQWLASLITNCRVFRSGAWRNLSGVDDLVYCMESGYDSAIPSIYFSQRGRPQGVSLGSNSYAFPPRASVRTLWKWALFGDT